MSANWYEQVFKNFDDAADTYNNEAKIQKEIAIQLAELSSKYPIPKGLWLDLGSGTGFLAEALEKIHYNQPVTRVDIAPQMLGKHSENSKKKIWDLNKGLPVFQNPPTFISSSFALHWLTQPSIRLKEWFNCLASGGWIAIALPIEGSFEEWHQAATRANLECTAIPLPSKKSLYKSFNNCHIQYERTYKLTQKAPKVTSLLKPMIRSGAQTSKHSSLSVGDWRRLEQYWSRSTTSLDVSLTWLIQIAIIKK